MANQAIWQGLVIAESEDCIVVEGNPYFPPADVKTEYLVPSDKETICPWKGKAKYYDLVAQRTAVKNAAWTYPNPKEQAKRIKEHIAFTNEIEIVEK